MLVGMISGLVGLAALLIREFFKYLRYERHLDKPVIPRKRRRR